MAKQDDYVRYTVRIPRDLYAAIEASANAANRSVNSEIIESLRIAQLNEKGSNSDLLQKMGDMQIDITEREQKQQEKEMYWHNIALALVNSRRSQLARFRSILKHILNYEGLVPEPLILLVKKMLDVFEKDISDLPDSFSQMKFLQEQSKKAHELVYADVYEFEGTEYEINPSEFRIYPPSDDK